jgi:hypothetical protein
VAAVATVGIEYTGTDDAAPFEVGQAVYLLDSAGTRIDADAPPATIAGVAAGALTVAFVTVPAPPVGSILVLANYDDVAAAVRPPYAWQASPAGTLGAAADPGFVWS